MGIFGRRSDRLQSGKVWIGVDDSPIIMTVFKNRCKPLRTREWIVGENWRQAIICEGIQFLRWSGGEFLFPPKDPGTGILWGMTP
jgi:hypothetical protein